MLTDRCSSGRRHMSLHLLVVGPRKGAMSRMIPSWPVSKDSISSKVTEYRSHLSIKSQPNCCQSFSRKVSAPCLHIPPTPKHLLTACKARPKAPQLPSNPTERHPRSIISVPSEEKLSDQILPSISFYYL